MKKIMYAIYVTGVVVMLVFAKTAILSADTISLIFLGVALIMALFCFGSYNAVEQYHIETVDTLKDKLNSRNDPLLIKPYIIIVGPLIIGLIIAYFL